MFTLACPSEIVNNVQTYAINARVLVIHIQITGTYDLVYLSNRTIESILYLLYRLICIVICKT